MKAVILKDRKLIRIAYYALRWHLRYYLGKIPKPMVVGLFTTNRCNLRCSMCSIWRDKKKTTLSYDQLKSLVDAVTPGCCYFSFSGGEPLLVKDIDHMISYAASKIPYVHLVSNGMLLDTRMARRLKEAGLSEISLSLDGNKKWHNSIRGEEGSYDAVIEAVNSVKNAAPDMNIVLNTVLFPDAVEEARAAVAMAKELGVFIKIQPVNPHFQFEEADNLPEEPDFSKVDYAGLEALIAECLREKHVLNSKFYLRRIPSFFKGELKMPIIYPKCKLPYIYLECNSYGNVSPCMVATGWESEITIEDIGDPLKVGRYRSLQKRLEQCRRCEKTMFICCWEPMIHFPISHLLKYGLLG